MRERFVDRSTRWSGLGEARVERDGSVQFRSRALLRVARTRTRGDLEIETGGPTRAGRLSASGRLLFQAGPEGRSAGRILSGSSAWSPPPIPGKIGIRATFVAERSWAGADTLRALFDYGRVGPSVELRRPLGWTGDLAVRAGFTRKSTPGEASGAYRERWAEAAWAVFSPSRLRSDLRIRTESRSYARRGLLLPSYDQGIVEADATVPVAGRLQVRFSPSLARAAYASDDSLVFRDHWTAEGVLRAEKLLGGGPADSLSPWTGLENDWRLSGGVRVGWLRNERIRDADWHIWSLLFGFARETTGSWWFDLASEIGRRDYRGTGVAGSLGYEGFNISVSGTDYTFVSSSFLGQAALGRGLRLELFLLWDRELHREETDNFSLWACTATLTRGF